MLFALAVVVIVLTVLAAVFIPLAIWIGRQDISSDSVLDEVSLLVFVFIVFGVWISMAFHG